MTLQPIRLPVLKIGLFILLLHVAAWQQALLREPYHFVGLDDRHQVLRIEADRRFDGRLVVLGASQVLVENAWLSVAGALLIGDDSLLRLTEGNLSLRPGIRAVPELFCTDQGRVEVKRSRIDGQGERIRAALFDQSVVSVSDGSVDGVLAWIVADEARLHLSSCSGRHEVQALDAASAMLTRCHSPLVWLTIPPDRAAILTDIAGGDISLWSSAEADIEPLLGGEVTIRDCANVRFGVQIDEGGEVDLANCALTAIRLSFSMQTAQPILLRELHAKERSDFAVEAGPTRMSASDTSVGVWEVHVAGESSLRMEACRDLHRVFVTGEGRLAAENSAIGSGAEALVLVEDRGLLSLIHCRVDARVLLAGDSVATLYGVTFSEKAELTIAGGATAALLNCSLEAEPRVLHEGLLIEASLPDFQAKTGAEALVPGFAQLRTATHDAPVSTPYELSYRPAEGDVSWQHLEVGETRPDGGLALWDTSSLQSGRYLIRLSVSHPRGAQVTFTANAILAAPDGAAPGTDGCNAVQ